jgi:hypothetical protein
VELGDPVSWHVHIHYKQNIRRGKLNSQFIVTDFFNFACGRAVLIQISN